MFAVVAITRVKDDEEAINVVSHSVVIYHETVF